MTSRCVLVILLALVVLGNCGYLEGKAPCEKPYTCPDREWINCMPIVEGTNNECVGECHDWVVEHCPDVRFAL